MKDRFVALSTAVSPCSRSKKIRIKLFLWRQTLFTWPIYCYFSQDSFWISSTLSSNTKLHFQFKDNCVTTATILITQVGAPFQLFLDDLTGTEICPVNYLQRYCSMRGTPPGALFCFSDGSPVKTSHFPRQLRQALNFCRLDSSKF